MTKYVLTLLAFVAFALAAQAQQAPRENITGIVKTTDGKPAEYVSVSLKGTTYGALTDEKGAFSFAAPAGRYTLVAFSVYTQRKELPVTIQSGVTNHFADITVAESQTQLEEVVVTGQFAPQSLSKSLYKVRVINNLDIQQKASTDIQSLLNTEIGIRISNDMTLGESNFELMGMSGNNVKVLLDGVPLIDRGATKQSLSQIDINTIEQVEIVEGPMSVIYGTDALAGVINIITKKARVEAGRDTYSVSVNVQEESVGSEYSLFDGKGIHNESVQAAWASRTGVYLNGGFTRNATGGWVGDKTGREKMWPPKEQYYYEGLVGYKKNDFNIWYRLNYMDETIFTPQNPTGSSSTVITDRDFLTDRFNHSLQADWKVSPKVAINLVGSLQNYKRRTRTVVTDEATGEQWLSEDESAQDVTKYDAAFLRATAAWTINSKVSLQPGLEYHRDGGSGGRLDGKRSISSTAAFLSAEWRPADWFSLRPGVRTILAADYDAPLFIPSVGTKFSFTNDMDLRLSYAYGFRAPTLQELYFSFHNANHNIDGNPDLKAEYSQNITGSFTWRVLHNDNIRLTSTLSGFYNSFRDRITTTWDVNDPTHTTYYNIDKYKTTGGTFENSAIWRNLQVSLGISLVGRYNSYADSDEFASKDLPTFRFSPEVTGTATYVIDKTKTNLNLYYKFTGKRQEYFFNSETEDLYLGGLESYHTADFTLSQRMGKYLQLKAGVKNIFDVTTINNTSGGGGHSSAGSSSLMGCGRSYFVGLSFLLSN